MKKLHSAWRIRRNKVARKLVRPSVLLGLILVPLALVLLAFLYLDKVYDYQGDLVSTKASSDLWNTGYKRLRLLDQGWDEGERAWFYNVTQGSDLVPYDIVQSLRSSDGKTPFLSDENIKRWRYISQPKCDENPDGLPIGFARDEYKGRTYLGLTCSACHTTEVYYKDTAVRIDGGPAMSDFQAFMDELGTALDDASKLDAKGKCQDDACSQLVKRVLARGNYDSPKEVIDDLITAKRRVFADLYSNHAAYPYGFGRLDAFGRIYNRVLSRVLQKEDIEHILPAVFEANELPAIREELKSVLQSGREDDVAERTLALLSEDQRKRFIEHVYNSPTAPVSYPFIWDIPQHDYVQWNGIAANGDFGALGRNVGEVMGVFGILEWKKEPGFSFASLLSGQKAGKEHVSFESSVYVHNLRRIEGQLASLESPVWPSDIFGELDAQRIARGEVLFDDHCASCHANIDRDSPERRIVANMTKLKSIKTDVKMAENSAAYGGYSGLLRNQYVDIPGVGSMLIDRQAPVAALLIKSTQGVIAAPYPGKNVFTRFTDWVSDLLIAFFKNEIRPSIKHGNYDPDTTVKPFASVLSYKGRSLNGIWATAPYLHNGSVPTLYDLLLPKCTNETPAEGKTPAASEAQTEGDTPAETTAALAGEAQAEGEVQTESEAQAEGEVQDEANTALATQAQAEPKAGDGKKECRPDKFVVGSRKFDPVNVGFVDEDYDGFVFDTSLPGNSNAGHNYGTGLTKEDRLDLVEYMKYLGCEDDPQARCGGLTK